MSLMRRSGDVLMAGKAVYTELFSAGSGNRYVSGFQGLLNIKHDGNGSVMVDPMSGVRSSCSATGVTPAALDAPKHA